jgi:hypothetical protein
MAKVSPQTLTIIFNLQRRIEQASVTADAVEATTQESKRIWNLP